MLVQKRRYRSAHPKPQCALNQGMLGF